jgi:hypothetical protein
MAFSPEALMNPMAYFVLCLQLLTPPHAARPPEIVMDTRKIMPWAGLVHQPAPLLL